MKTSYELHPGEGTSGSSYGIAEERGEGILIVLLRLDRRELELGQDAVDNFNFDAAVLMRSDGRALMYSLGCSSANRLGFPKGGSASAV